MKFPMHLTFKKLALAPQITVTDADGTLQLYVKQKLFKLKESVTVFADREQTRPLYRINADRIMDFSARYNFTDEAGNELGAVRRQGMRSLWRSRYDILRGDTVIMGIQEENPWVKVIDGLVGEIPIVGMLTGYMFHPAFAVTHPNGATVMRLVKEPAFFEGKFLIEKQWDLPEEDQTVAVLSLVMMTLLERQRG